MKNGKQTGVRYFLFFAAFVCCGGCVNIDLPFFKGSESPMEDVVIAPDNPHYHFYLGREALEKGDSDEALKHFNRAVGLQPDFFEARVGAGHALMEMEKYSKARRAYEQALELRDTPELRLSLARANLFDRRLDEAQSLADSALDNHPQPAEVWEVLGSVAYQRGDLAQAERCWATSLEIDQSNDALVALLNDLRSYLQTYPPARTND